MAKTNGEEDAKLKMSRVVPTDVVKVHHRGPQRRTNTFVLIVCGSHTYDRRCRRNRTQ